MAKKIIVIALIVFAFGFGSALRSNAGTEMIEPYRAPAPTYNYAPPPRRARSTTLLLRRLASSSTRAMAITGRGSGSTVPTDSTADTDTVIGVLIITGANQQNCSGGVRPSAFSCSHGAVRRARCAASNNRNAPQGRGLKHLRRCVPIRG
jgi:hypothetical protein